MVYNVFNIMKTFYIAGILAINLDPWIDRYGYGTLKLQRLSKYSGGIKVVLSVSM
jgi:hypothetical protein